ncbi:hypothetical protein WICPIJ_002865 [Wickerhamomyces pijperi]|uniref:NADP-dependent oxidoreductase domain-containing protein n=1 Tax=Wickerhamomyces pijperi TaxID=599730 RepID=A0A9P8Q8Z2_WICPI|nr:hypothetical protein WICPIJ_002865 [Wickerhamomyces pijperi]
MSSYFTLKNGLKAPLVGLGLWKIPPSSAADQVYNAIKLGYRLFDGAADYGNEVEVGQGIKRALDEGIVKREDLFIVSKLWNTFHAPANVKIGLDKTLKDLGLDYVDLYYIHFPIATEFVPVETKYPPAFGVDDNAPFVFEDVPIIETYRALEEAVDAGKVKSLGISNFPGALIQDLLRNKLTHPPVALQIEHHPYLVQPRLVKYAQDLGLFVVAYSTFGPQSFVELNHPKVKNVSKLFDHELIKSIAKAHGKEPSQILLRWVTQRGLAVIPKSSNPERLLQNLQVENFDLTEDEIKQISDLDIGLRFNDPWDWKNQEIPTFV